MKTAILAAILVLSNFALAAKPGKVATLAESKAYVESKESLKSYKQDAEAGRLTDSAKKEMTKYLGELTSKLSGVNSTNLEILTSIHPESLAKVIHLASLIKEGKPEEKISAEKDLKLFSLAGKYTKMSKVEAEFVERITEINTDYSKDFKAEFIKILDLNIAINIIDAVKIASKGKIILDKDTLENFKNCTI